MRLLAGCGREYPGSAKFFCGVLVPPPSQQPTFAATNPRPLSLSIALTTPLPQPLLRSSKDGPRSTDPQPARSSPHKQACIPQCCQGVCQQPRGQVNWAPCRRFPWHTSPIIAAVCSPGPCSIACRTPKTEIVVSPSILSANFATLGEEVRAAQGTAAKSADQLWQAAAAQDRDRCWSRRDTSILFCTQHAAISSRPCFTPCYVAAANAAAVLLLLRPCSIEIRMDCRRCCCHICSGQGNRRSRSRVSGHSQPGLGGTDSQQQQGPHSSCWQLAVRRTVLKPCCLMYFCFSPMPLT